jgi:DNA polymerase-1
MNFRKKLLLVDGHALFYRAFHALPNMTGPGGFPTGAIFGFLSMLFKALVDIKPTHALITFDTPGKTFRDTLSADYKATRKAPPDDLMIQLPKLKEILTALDFPIYEKVGFEADDLLGIISHKTPKDVLNIIVTGDLDLLQLIDNHTHVYRFKIGFSDIQIFDADKMVEIYGLHPSQWVDYKAIRGDTSDNIPGVPGIGEKGALELIKTFGSLDGVYEAVKKGATKIKAGTLKKLEEGKLKAYLSYKLARIDQKNNLDFDFEKTLLGDYDQVKVKELLHQVGIKALDNRLPRLSDKAAAKIEKLEEQEIKSAPKKKSVPNDLIKNDSEALIAAYLCDPGRREYDTSDWDNLAKQMKEKKLLEIYNEVELPLMSVLGKMQSRGVKVDLGWLKSLSKKLAKRIDELTKQIHKEAKTEFNIASPIQLREVLFEKLKIPTDNIKKTGKTKALSTGADQLGKLRDLHPIIELIFEYRELTKLKSTYIDSLPQLVAKDGRVHTTYSQTISAHGRLSSINPNLQNIPIKTELGNEVRKAFVTDKGQVLLSLDYSQIELRIAASLSNDAEMVEIFKKDEDFHTATASKIFNIDESKVTPAQRRAAKTINFSVLYGVSAFGLSEKSEMSRAEAAEHIKKYYEVFAQLRAYINGLIQIAHQDGFMTNPLGRIRFFPDIHASNFAIRSGAERQAVNMPIQSLAADIMKMAIIEIDKKFPDVGMLLTVHDELVFEVKKDEEKKYAKEIKKIMESVYKLKVPLKVEAKFGINWAEMEKLEFI